MAIIWVDWVTGLDTNAGTDPALPKKTITSATLSRTGGDEIRVAKSPDPTPLTGIISFVTYSSTIYGNGTLFLTELAVGDFILAPNGMYYEILSILANDRATLYKPYYDSSFNDFSSFKLGVTDTGAAAAASTQVQAVSSSGTNENSMLLISGGWDLSTQSQTGKTWFRQMHATLTYRYGYGLALSAKSFVKISKINFVRYNTGVFINTGSNYVTVEEAEVCSCGTGVYMNKANYGTLENLRTIACNYPIYVNDTNSWKIIKPKCHTSNNVAISFATNSHNNLVIEPECTYAIQYGIYISQSFHNIIVSPTCTKTVVGIIFYQASNNNKILGTFTSIDNGYDVALGYGQNYINKLARTGSGSIVLNLTVSSVNNVYINDINGFSRVVGYGFDMSSELAVDGGTGKQWKIGVTQSEFNSYRPKSVPLAKIAVKANAKVTVSCFFKKTGLGIGGALMCSYGQVAWSNPSNDIIATCPNDTLRNNVSLEFTPTESGVVEISVLAWYVSSVSDTFSIDDFNIIQGSA